MRLRTCVCFQYRQFYIAELPLLNCRWEWACYHTTVWKFYTARPGTVCQKQLQVLSGWVIRFCGIDGETCKERMVRYIFLTAHLLSFFSTVCRGWLFGNSALYSEFSYCGPRTDHLLCLWVYLSLVSWQLEGKYCECALKWTKTTCECALKWTKTTCECALKWTKTTSECALKCTKTTCECALKWTKTTCECALKWTKTASTL